MLRQIFVILLLTICSASWAKTVSKTLDNGLKVIIKEDHRAPVAVSQLWYRVGSIDEKPDKTGLSHALEHMMFKGTDKIPEGEFVRRISALGGQFNAYTNRNETVYYENIAAANIPEILAMEADRMTNINFSDKTFLNEMEVIREERRLRTEDSANGKLWEHVFLNSYQTPSLRAPIIGYMEDLYGLKAEDLRQWYHQWYVPNNATLVIVGDVNAKDLLKNIIDLFGHIPARSLPARNNIQEPENSKAVRAQTTSEVTHLPLLSISYRVPKLNQINDRIPYALDVLTDILSGDTSSRLEARLVRGNQIALNIDSIYDMFSRELPLFSISAVPANGISVDKLLDNIRKEITDIAKNGVQEEELKRVLNRALATEIYSKDSMTTQASLMGLLESRGFRYSDEKALRQRSQKVTVEDVQKAAQLLTPERETVVVVYPDQNSKKKQVDQAIPTTQADPIH